MLGALARYTKLSFWKRLVSQPPPATLRVAIRAGEDFSKRLFGGAFIYLFYEALYQKQELIHLELGHNH